MDSHLQARMVERGITEEQVRAALSTRPEINTSSDSLCYRYAFPDGRTLKVWTQPGTKEPRVIKSAAWEGSEK